MPGREGGGGRATWPGARRDLIDEQRDRRGSKRVANSIHFIPLKKRKEKQLFALSLVSSIKLHCSVIQGPVRRAKLDPKPASLSLSLPLLLCQTVTLSSVCVCVCV